MDHNKAEIINNYWVSKIVSLKKFGIEEFQPLYTNSFVLKTEQLAYFSKLTGDADIAKFTVCLAVFNGLLQRYFETPLEVVSNGINNGETYGLYIFPAIEGKTLKEFLNEVKTEVAQVHKYANFEDSQDLSNQLKSYAPYQFNYLEEKSATSKAPFVLHLNKVAKDALEVSLSYSVQFVDSLVAEHFSRNFKNWIVHLEEYLPKRISQIPIVSQKEQKVLLEDFNSTSKEFDNTTILDLFTRQVQSSPERVAVVFGDTQLTYKQLQIESNRFAWYLKDTHQLSKGDLVGVKLTRDHFLMVAILAVLKLRAAYVPIDVDYPLERVQYIEQDSKCRFVVDVQCVKQFKKVNTNFSKGPLPNLPVLEDSAYIIYTSGTTGKPKGVQLSHNNVSQLIHWSIEEFNPSQFKIVYAVTSHCFDLSVFEMFYPLAIGKTIRVLKNALEIEKYAKEDSHILLNTVPSAVRNLIDNNFEFGNIKVINLAGEPFPVDIAHVLLSHGLEVRNLYGPSEDTTYSTCYQLTDKQYKTIPIGKPISNTQAYILDDYGQLSPMGLPGRLYLSGEGIATAYLNKPELTAQKFLIDPFRHGKKMYDTGDMAKWSADGNLIFLGRKDSQIKLRGYRIELEEIENAMRAAFDEIIQAVVALKEVNGQTVLAGYFLSKEAVNLLVLRKYLEAKLPAYMIPSYFIPVSTIPTTLTGKIDRASLPEVLTTNLPSEEFIAPRTKQEQVLVKIWEEVLGIKGIGIKDHFFNLGGHSLMISQIINKISQRLEKEVSFKLFYENPTVEILSDALRKSKFTNFPKASSQESYPVTKAQGRFWLLSQFDGGEEAYQISGALKIEGDLEINYLEESLQQIIAKHEILRTVFKPNNHGELRQYILPTSQIKTGIYLEDFSAARNPLHAVNTHILGQNKQPYNLSKHPLFKVSLLKISKSAHILFLSMHHIIGDGMSLNILLLELTKNYDCCYDGDKLLASTLKLQFKDYAVWTQQQAQDKEYLSSLAYWKQQFSEEIPVLQLPTFKARPLLKSYDGQQLTHVYSQELTSQLRSFSKQHEITLFTTLMAGVRVLISRYANQEDTVIGTPVSLRSHPDLETQIGLYINTLAIRSQIEKGDHFIDVQNKEKNQLLMAYEHQEVPFDVIVEELKLQRDISRSPLFDVLVVFQNQQQSANFQSYKTASNLLFSEHPIKRETAQFDLGFNFLETENNITLTIDFNTDIYHSDFVHGIFQHFENLLTKVLAEPLTPINEIDIISNLERETLLKTFNTNKVDLQEEVTVLTRFNQQVLNNSRSVALIDGHKELTYASLDVQSNELANYLIQQYNVCGKDIIAVCLPPEISMVVSLLAVLKTGAAYVPIDPNYPVERSKFILEDTKAKLVIDETFYDNFTQVALKDDAKPLVNVTGTNLAYVIYTSGSTGTPKGVMIEHKSLSNFLSFYQLETHRTTLSCNFVFDVSVVELFSAITSGSTLVIPAIKTVMAPKAYGEFLFQNKISHAYIHPMHLEQIANQLALYDKIYLKRILVGVEGIKKEAVSWYVDHAITVINGYGPTEATICATYFKINDLHSISTSNIPIGIPIPNYSVYILNTSSQVLEPIGVIGELCIAGTGLSRGYLNREDLTSQKFELNPFAKGEKMYRTGDLARWLPDGNLEFVGRKDAQVKLRGHRIELGEIESVLNSFKEIEKAVVLIKETEGDKQLITYVVGEIEIAGLRAKLSKFLPNYMIPSRYVLLDDIPLTINGKIDRKQLLSLDHGALSTTLYVAPRNTLENQLVTIWQEALHIKRIGVEDNFFELGGHSLTAVKVSNQIQRALGFTVSINDIFKHATIASLAASLSISEYKSIPKTAVKSSYSLTPSQHRLWVLSQFDKGNVAYNIPNVLELTGAFNYDTFLRSVRLIIARHESLRTSFRKNELGELGQYILGEDEIDFTIPISRIDEKDAVGIDKLLTRSFSHAFDLSQAPLLMVEVIKLNQHKHLLSFNLHHIIGDGWSMEVLCNEIILAYNSLMDHQPPIFSPLEIQYKDYSAWLESNFKKEALDKSKAYWKERFKGTIPVLDLPTSNIRPSVRTYNGASFRHTFSKEFRLKLQRVCAKVEATPFMGLMAIMNGLLYRLTGQQDIVLGTPVAGREHPDLENQIGLYLNTLAIRTTFQGSLSIQDLIELQKETLEGDYAHQNYPFDMLVDQLEIKRDSSRSALFDILVAFQNQKDVFNFNDEKLIGINIKPLATNFRETSQFDMSFSFADRLEGLMVVTEYNTDIYSEDFIGRFLHYFEQFFLASTKATSQSIDSIDYLPAQEKVLLLKGFNATKTNYPKNETIISLFSQQALRSPGMTALIFEDSRLTYSQLDAKSSQLSNWLTKHYDIQPGDLVGIKLARSQWPIISILGILKCGAAYVPMDPSYPLDRINYIEAECDCKLTINQSVLNSFLEVKDLVPEVKKKIKANPLDLAYVMYTSGSTGTPKGVMVANRSVVRLVKDTNYYNFSKFDILLATGSLSFDATTFEFWGPLLNGASLVLCSKETLLDSNALASVIEYHSVNVMWFTAGWLNQLVDTSVTLFKDLSTLLVGGDKLSPFHIQRLKLLYPQLSIINGYGPTENTTFSLTHAIENISGDIPIGKPVSNSTVLILDHNDALVPVGFVGEICLGGDGLSMGYMKQEELTAQKFVKHPFINGERIYKTGDLGKISKEGVVEFMGRKDDQVKIRGHRIELGEIENHLVSKPDLQDAVILVNSTKNVKELVAYIVSPEKQSAKDLRAYLLKVVPAYMVPSFFVQIKQLPLNANGKVDKHALESMDGEQLSTNSDYKLATTKIEQKLVAIWQEVLEVQNIGVTDNFFELGGHSLKASRLIQEYHKSFSIQFSMKDIFTHTTIASHGMVIESLQAVVFPEILKVEDREDYPLLGIQKGMWIASQYANGSSAYNMPFYKEILINRENFEKAFTAVFDRHEVLRTVFKENKEGEIRQKILTVEQLNFQVGYLDVRDKGNVLDKITQFMTLDIDVPFNLERGPLVRATLLHIAKDRYVFYLNMHHMISDGWSLEVLTNDVLAYYDAFQNNTVVNLPPLRIQYRDYVHWRLTGQHESLKNHKQYWLSQLQGEVPNLNLSIASKRPKIKTYEGDLFKGKILKSNYTGLTSLSSTLSTTLYINLVSIVTVLLYRYSYENQLIIGSPVAGREHPDLKDQIGCYINTVPLRFTVDEEEKFSKFLTKTKTLVLDAHQHQDYPFETLLEDLNYKRDLSRSPLFDVMVVMNQEFQNSKVSPYLSTTLEEVAIGPLRSKLDLTFFFKEDGDQINCEIVYNSGLFQKTQIGVLFNDLCSLITFIVKDPSVTIQECIHGIISKEEHSRLDSLWDEVNEVIDESF